MIDVPHVVGTSAQAKRVMAPPWAETSNEMLPPAAVVPVYLAPGTWFATAGVAAASINSPTARQGKIRLDRLMVSFRWRG